MISDFAHWYGYPRIEEICASRPSTVLGYPMFIRFITTGGTIDKIYFDALSQFKIGDRRSLYEGLADFRVSHEIHFASDLPRVTLGKVDKKELRKRTAGSPSS